MAQWVGEFATKPDDVTLIPRLHMIKGKNPLLKVIL